MDNFLTLWGEAAHTTVGLFWMALWAFALGYVVSSMIQVFVTPSRMKKMMGGEGAKAVGLGAFFGFISSSCSFAALATTKSLFKKGAGFMPAMAFLLASTNLVVELGIIIGLFLSWQFVVGEYIGGILLILTGWLFVKITKPKSLIAKTRESLGASNENETQGTDWRQEILSIKGWRKVGMQYGMEWDMVWKDVTVGFTIAGIIAAFVPATFFESMFLGTGTVAQAELSFGQVLQQTLVGPLAAFFTFIGSMGNIPLAALLFANGVSFAGVMAFIFSDLVVFPVLRINAKYYGWKMSIYILFMLLSALVVSTLAMHYGFLALDMLPEMTGESIKKMVYFKLDYGFWLNILFLLLSAWLVWQSRKMNMQHHGHEMPSKGWLEKVLKVLAIVSYGWLIVGLGVKYFL